MRNLFTASTIAVVACMVAAPAFAQETTSSIRGLVTSGGAPVIGASVTVTHEPSGTVSTTSTGADGSFTAAGLRIGGPFTVKVTAGGFADASVTDIDLTAGQPLRLPVELAASGAEIVVTAASTRATELSPGPITALNREAIEGVASTRRDIRDIARRDPFATLDPSAGGGSGRGVSIAGQNARLNKFSVDGLRFSDNFGLNNGGLPTERGPVPLDAIEQFSVKVAPFDISEGDFQGGAINVVLRSGTNKIHGSGFYTYTDDKLTGKKFKPDALYPTGVFPLPKFSSKTFGGFLSGPIIKDKLFLAVSYEKLNEGTPVPIVTVPGLQTSQVDSVTSIVNSVYGYATGGILTSTTEKDEKYTVKVDWNAMEGQRVSLTYIHNDSSNVFTSNNATTIGSPTLSLSSNDYIRPEKVDSYVGQLVSDWADNFHTEIRGNYRKYDLTPVPLGAFNFAQFQICTDPTGATTPSGVANVSNAITCSQGASGNPGASRLYIGPDNFRHFNYVRTTQYGADIAARWEMGGISMKATAAWMHLDVANAFTPNALGNFFFDSLADLQNRRAASFAYAGSITGNLNDVLASFKYDQYTFGLQGSIDPTPTLNITAGARVDLYGGIQAPPYNQFFFGRTGIANTYVIDGKYVAQPRISATWDPSSQIKVRGGLGLFSGGSPDVFLGNSYSQANVFGNAFTITRNADGTCTIPTAVICSAALDNVNGKTFPTAVLDYLRTNTGSLSAANVNAMDPNFKIASTYKATLSVDYRPDFEFLGRGWNVGGDFYYGWVNNAPVYYDLRIYKTGTAPDGRPRYTSLTPTSANTDLLLTNTKLGHSLVTVARINKRFRFGLDLGVSYTYQDIKDVSAVNGTTGAGTYGATAMLDPNRPLYGTSTYQVRNSWKFSADFDHAFFGDYKTRLSLFGELRSGLPYSITMVDLAGSNAHGNVFGATGTTGRYLLYVPLSGTDPLVTYDSAATQATLDTVIANYGLGKYRGRIIPKNTQRSPNWFKVDLHAEQEIPLPLVDKIASGARIKLFADVENVLNLINRDWGTLRQVAFPYLAPVVNVACATFVGANCTQYRYSNANSPQILNLQRPSLYAIRVGAKVQF